MPYLSRKVLGPPPPLATSTPLPAQLLLVILTDSVIAAAR